MNKTIEIPEGYEARIEGNKVILEPKVSEDERIRRELIRQFSLISETWFKNIFNGYVTKEQMIAYLERQKEQNPVEITPNQFDGITYGMNGYSSENPAGWSKEDEKILNELLDHCNTENATWYNWLKSLHPQPKGEIYKSAKHNLAIRFMNYLDENRPDGKMSLSSGECEDIDKAFIENDWAKIMRYAEKYSPSWKPSKEQMEALQTVYEYLSTSTPENIKLSDILRGLYNDIK